MKIKKQKTMKNLFLKVKQWFLSHSFSMNLLILSAAVAGVALASLIVSPKQFNFLTALIIVSYLLNVYSNLSKKQ